MGLRVEAGIMAALVGGQNRRCVRRLFPSWGLMSLCLPNQVDAWSGMPTSVTSPAATVSGTFEVSPCFKISVSYEIRDKLRAYIFK